MRAYVCRPILFWLSTLFRLHQTCNTTSSTTRLRNRTVITDYGKKKFRELVVCFVPLRCLDRILPLGNDLQAIFASSFCRAHCESAFVHVDLSLQYSSRCHAPPSALCLGVVPVVVVSLFCFRGTFSFLLDLALTTLKPSLPPPFVLLIANGVLF